MFTFYKCTYHWLCTGLSFLVQVAVLLRNADLTADGRNTQCRTSVLVFCDLVPSAYEELAKRRRVIPCVWKSLSINKQMRVKFQQLSF